MRRYRDLDVPPETLARKGALAPDDPVVVALCRSLASLNRSGADRRQVAAELRRLFPAKKKS
jgi:hypothetical protein